MPQRRFVIARSPRTRLFTMSGFIGELRRCGTLRSLVLAADVGV